MKRISSTLFIVGLFVLFSGFGPVQSSHPHPFFAEKNTIQYTRCTYPNNGNGTKQRIELNVTSVANQGNSLRSEVAVAQYNKYEFCFEHDTWNYDCDTNFFYVHSANWSYYTGNNSGTATAEGDSLKYPLKMKAGDTLPPAWATRKLVNSYYTVNTRFDFFKRKVIALDSLNTPFGAVMAYRIEMTMVYVLKTLYDTGQKSTKKNTVQVTEWFVPEIGIVKSEMRDPEVGFTSVIMDSYKK